MSRIRIRGWTRLTLVVTTSVSLVEMSMTGTATAAEGAYTRIVAHDGAVWQGRLGTQGAALRVEEALRTVYLSPRVVARQDAIAAPEPPPTYRMNAGRIRRSEQKGKLGLVLKHSSYSPPDEAGAMVLTCTDMVLGPLTVHILPVRVTPWGVDYEGVEYAYSGSFSGGDSNVAFACHLAQQQTPADDPRAQLTFARFARLAGQGDIAQDVLTRLSASTQPVAGLAEEIAALAEMRVRQQLADVQRLRLSGDDRAWLSAATALAAAPVPAAVTEAVTALRTEAQEAAAVLAGADAALAQASATAPIADAPIADVQEARQLQHVLALAGSMPSTIPPALLPRLKEPWATDLQREDLGAPRLQDAVALADRTAGVMQSGEAAQVKALAQDMAQSPLSTAVKLAMVRHAAVVPSTLGTWQRQEFRHPDNGKTYHYYALTPESYRPGRPTPVVVSLHGQVTKADVMRNFWGATTYRWGMILISPEYIYGRDSGYQQSTEEHQAVLGALRHASTLFSIDPDRVYLQGHSQGGHASWDIGPAHAGTFAGVVPLLGVPLDTPLSNFQDTALYAVDGADDAGAPARVRDAMADLARLSCDARYMEYPGRRHEAFFEEYDAIARWMLQHVRAPHRALHLAPVRAIDAARSWLRLEASGWRREGFPQRDAHVTAEASWTGNTCTVRCQGVQAVHVLIDPRLVDIAKPVQVVINGKTFPPRPVVVDWHFAITDVLARGDRGEVLVQQQRYVVGR